MSAVVLASCLAVATERSASPGDTAGPDPVPRSSLPPGLTFRQLTAAADAAEADSTAALRRDRYEGILAYVRGHPAAQDLEEARFELVDLAEDMKARETTLERAGEYLAAHRSGKRRGEVLRAKADALAALGRKDEARAAFEAAAQSAMAQKPPDDDLVYQSLSRFADWLLDVGDLLGARSTLERLKAAFHEESRTKQVAALVDPMLAVIEKIGKAPDPFPDGTKDMDGAPVALSDFGGKVVLVVFWATTGSPSTKFVAKLPGLASAYGARGLELVDVALDPEADREKVRAFVAGQPWPGRHVHDAARDVSKVYAVENVPYMVLLGRDGKVVRMGRLADDIAPLIERTLAPR